jgi:protease IV
MKFARTLEKVTFHPWLITPGGYEAVMRLIDSRLNRESAFDSLPEELPNKAGGKLPLSDPQMAQILVSGILGQRLSMLEQICGGCDYLDIAQSIDDVVAAEAQGILFIFDSPGGMAVGCPELAAKIASLDIPTVAFTDSIMTSGAYYLASGCDYIAATPSAQVGSIGVILPWVDKSKLWDKMGLEFDPIYSEGDTLKPTMYGPALSEEQRSYLQQNVNDVAEAFQTHVASFRALDFGQLKAGSYSGNRALSYNLIDKIGSLKDAQNELSRRIQKAQA